MKFKVVSKRMDLRWPLKREEETVDAGGVAEVSNIKKKKFEGYFK